MAKETQREYLLRTTSPVLIALQHHAGLDAFSLPTVAARAQVSSALGCTEVVHMTNCCQSDCQTHLSVERFSGIASTILQKRIPYSVDVDRIMICSPVGNQSKFGRRKADIALSGYSTSPEATIKYVHDAGSMKDPERLNSFNTHRMKSGIREIFCCLGFIDGDRLPDTAFTSQLNPDLNILLTQMLCMISKGGSAKARYVEGILRRSAIIREQAEYSVTAWYERIRSCLKEGGIILLMGNNARNLIENTYWTGDNKFEIGFDRRQSDRWDLDNGDLYASDGTRQQTGTTLSSRVP